MAVPPFPVEQNYPDHDRGEADEDLYRLDCADVRAEFDRAARGVGAGRSRFTACRSVCRLLGAQFGEESVLALAAEVAGRLVPPYARLRRD